MKILVVSDYAPSETHGIALHIRNMVREMRLLGHEMMVFTCKNGKELTDAGYREIVSQEEAKNLVENNVQNADYNNHDLDHKNFSLQNITNSNAMTRSPSPMTAASNYLNESMRSDISPVKRNIEEHTSGDRRSLSQTEQLNLVNNQSDQQYYQHSSKFNGQTNSLTIESPGQQKNSQQGKSSSSSNSQHVDIDLSCYHNMGVCVVNPFNTDNRICIIPSPKLFYHLAAQSQQSSSSSSSSSSCFPNICSSPFRPDIVHIFAPSIIATPVLVWTSTLGIPTYVSHHCDMVYYVRAYNPFETCVGNKGVVSLQQSQKSTSSRKNKIAKSNPTSPMLSPIASGKSVLSQRPEAQPLTQQTQQQQSQSVTESSSSSCLPTSLPCRSILTAIPKHTLNLGMDVVLTMFNRLPAALCADANVAPSLSSMRKEFRFKTRCLYNSYLPEVVHKDSDLKQLNLNGNNIIDASSIQASQTSRQQYASSTAVVPASSGPNCCLCTPVLFKGITRLFKKRVEVMKKYLTNTNSSSSQGEPGAGNEEEEDDDDDVDCDPGEEVDCFGMRQVMKEEAKKIKKQYQQMQLQQMTNNQKNNFQQNFNNSRISYQDNDYMVIPTSVPEIFQKAYARRTKDAHDSVSQKLDFGTNEVSSSDNKTTNQTAKPINSESESKNSTDNNNVSLRHVLNLTQQQSSKKIVLMVSRIAPEKGVDVGIRAIAGRSDIHLVVCGDGPSRKSMEQLAADLIVKKNMKNSIGQNSSVGVNVNVTKEDILTDMKAETARVRKDYIEANSQRILNQEVGGGGNGLRNENNVNVTNVNQTNNITSNTNFNSSLNAVASKETLKSSASTVSTANASNLGGHGAGGVMTNSSDPMSTQNSNQSNNTHSSITSQQSLSSSSNLRSLVDPAALQEASSPIGSPADLIRNVTFIGKVDNNLLPQLFYQQSDVFLTCSLSETFGITVAEALACDLLPIMPYSSPVFREFYEDSIGEAGLMYRDNDHLEEILDGIGNSNNTNGNSIKASYVLNETQKKRLSNKVFFSWRDAAIETINQYKRVIEKKKGVMLE